MVGVLLAAGKSSRFGANKILASLPDSVPIGIRSAETLKKCVDDLLVVVDSQNTATRSLFVDHGYDVAVSQNSGFGMGYSLSHGIAASSGATHWIIALADMPYLSLSTICKLRDFLVTSNQITVPVFEGRLGHPVGFPVRYREQLLRLTGDNGARSVLDRSGADTFFFMTCDLGVVKDIDVRSDLFGSDSSTQ